MIIPIKIIKYNLARKFNLNPPFPMNLTVSVTFRCNSRCQTCHIYNKKSEELSRDELGQVFKSIGKNQIYWITFSGGEVFLRNDFVDICESAYINCQPKVITIPTNGLLCEVIPDKVKKILDICKKTKVVINLSLDDIKEKHDFIRGVEGNFVKALNTYRALKSLKAHNLVLGVHTVISKFNVKRLPEIYNFVMNELGPDSYITEIAEEREELGTVGSDITPAVEDYCQAIDFLVDSIKKIKFSGLAKTTEAFRIRYYEMVKKILQDKKRVIPCYAGLASCHIIPNGDVWACCIKSEKIGNLKEAGYDFKKIWRSSRAVDIRKKIKNSDCFCPLANSSYTNMLLNAKCLLGIMRKA
ncbi:MAG: radical SAM protein [Candidatus Omnitrophica bacterium]|nr:radical SAM protein [Candidatus Omnitrophota bacterium]